MQVAELECGSITLSKIHAFPFVSTPCFFLLVNLTMAPPLPHYPYLCTRKKVLEGEIGELFLGGNVGTIDIHTTFIPSQGAYS
jgi:hypothetical protein